MQLNKFAAALALAAAGAAHADVSLLDASMYATLSGTNGAVIGDVTFASAAGNFITKTLGTPIISGLGVTGGRTGDEIDIRETVTMSWANGLTITSFAVGVLYNGPEYFDWAEIAQVTAWNGQTQIGIGQLQVAATGTTVANFTGSGAALASSATNLSPADSVGGGGWRVDNPFGNAQVTRLEFTALASNLCGPTSGCDNQSDYILSNVNAVPEPGTYALMLAGLGALGFVARRRSRRD